VLAKCITDGNAALNPDPVESLWWDTPATPLGSIY
jgi:hypothetical protein